MQRISRVPFSASASVMCGASIIVISAITLAFDLVLPLGVAAGVPYVLLVLIGLWARSSSCVLILATLATVFTLVGYHFSQAGADPQIVLLNRTITVCLIWVVAAAVAKVIEQRHQLYKLTRLDHLTGAHNRNFLSELLDHLVSKWRNNVAPLSLIALDLDDFKSINDLHGHLAGDQVLRAVSKICRKGIRETEYFCRYGGEEFLIVLPKVNLVGAYSIADRLRRSIEAAEIQYGETTLRVTASFGISEMTTTISDSRELVKIADAALYAAKENGRNRVQSAGQGLDCKLSDQSHLIGNSMMR